MSVKSRISALLINPLLVRWITLFSPHRFVIRFYLSSLISSSILPEEPVVKVASGYGRNLKMSLRIGDKLNPQETHYWFGFYELDVQRLFTKIVRTGSIVYDVGGYIGFYSLLAGRLTGSSGRVYAFEPFPKNIERLKLHILLNKMQDRVFCIPKAVSDKTGKALYRDLGRDDYACFVDVESYEDNHLTKASTIVDTISLDEFVFREDHLAPNLIKIDVEGGELKVLLGAQRLLKEFKPVIICELHSHGSAIQGQAIQVCKELTRLGYRLKDLRRRVMPFIPNHGSIVAWPKE